MHQLGDKKALKKIDFLLASFSCGGTLQFSDIIGKLEISCACGRNAQIRSDTKATHSQRERNKERLLRYGVFCQLG